MIGKLGRHRFVLRVAVVQGTSVVLVTVFVVLNTVVDLLYALLDPRVQLGTRAA